MFFYLIPNLITPKNKLKPTASLGWLWVFDYLITRRATSFIFEIEIFK